MRDVSEAQQHDLVCSLALLCSKLWPSDWRVMMVGVKENLPWFKNFNCLHSSLEIASICVTCLLVLSHQL